MTVITKTIGRLPVNLGDYNSTRAYGKKNRVLLYGCEWESKVENNTYPPATLVNGVVTPDTTHWRLNSGVPGNYGLDAEIGADNQPGTVKGRIKSLEDSVGTGGTVDQKIASAVQTEATRATGAETALGNRVTSLENEVGSGGGSNTLSSRVTALESGKADKATTIAGYGITDAYTKSETYTKTEVNGLVDTPHQEYVTVDAYANLPATGSKDTIYRVSNYNGSTSQVDASVYSEYAWNGSQYVFLCVKSQIGEVFDISVYNNNAKYADLTAALNGGANIPQSLQKGGMSVKFVQSNDNKYVQYFLAKDEWSVSEDDWQKINLEEEVSQLGQKIRTAREKILTYPSLSDNYKKILSLLNDFSLVVDEPFKDDVIIIDKLGITASNYLLFGIYNVTRNINVYSGSWAVSEISSSSFMHINYESNLYKLHVNIDVDAISSNIGVINTTSSNIVIDKGSASLSQFKDYNPSSPQELKIANAVKELQLIDNNRYSNADDDFKVTVFGFTTAGNLHGYIIIKNNGTEVISKTFDDSTSVPTGIKTYVVENNGVVVQFTVDWGILGSQWWNSNTSQLTIGNVRYPLDNTLTDIIKTPFKNIFDFETINLNKYPYATGVGNMDLNGFIASSFMRVEPGKIYKSSWKLIRIVYCNTESSWSRTVAGPTNIIKPTGNEKYVKIGCNSVDTSLETAIIHEVFDENDNVRNSSLELKDGTIIESDYSLMSINNTHKIVVSKGKIGTTANQLPLSVDSGEKLIAIPMSGNYLGKIKKLSFYCACDSTFTLTIGIGNVDQRNWGLLSSRTTINVSNGLNEIDTDITLAKGEKLFVIANSASSSANAKLYLDSVGYHQISEEDSVVMTSAVGTVMMQYTIDGVIYFDSELATKDIVGNVAEVASDNASRLDNLTIDKLYISSPDETLFKLKVANDGTLSTEQIPVSGKLLIMGNSYDVHGVAPGRWWGDFGMAASRKENDWKHIVLRRLRNEDNLIYNFTKFALADWERTFEDFDYSTLDEVLNDTYSMVIIRVGENSIDTDYQRVQQRAYSLLNYIITALGTSVPIVFGGCVKYRVEQNPYFEAACNSFDNVTYVDMTPAGRIEPFAAGLDYRVYGDDGVWHTISESSAASAVAQHPRDEVFAKMAELLYPVVVEKLGI